MIERKFSMPLLFDARWLGSHGIGRMTSEIRNRALATTDFIAPSWPESPVSPIDPFLRGAQLIGSPRLTFYSPGFNAPASGRERSVFTICDLIHLRIAGEAGALKRAYYEKLVKPAVGQAFRVLTISKYSRTDVLNWSGADPSQVLDVGCGVDEVFFVPAPPVNLGFPYFLYVGARKPHKNLDRLLEAYAASRSGSDIKLVLSGRADAHMEALAARLGIADRIHYAGRIPDADLPGWYRGATAVLFPSLFEGFGLPPVEAMAAGTPVMTSNATSLPEVVGDAALLIDPYSVDAMQDGIDRITYDSELRARFEVAGPLKAREHSWDRVAEKVQAVLSELKASVGA